MLRLHGTDIGTQTSTLYSGSVAAWSRCALEARVKVELVGLEPTTSTVPR
jgi:hypothetical protein